MCLNRMLNQLQSEKQVASKKQKYNTIQGILICIKQGDNIIYSGKGFTDSEIKQISHKALTNLNKN